jgi:hypothetical protein
MTLFKKVYRFLNSWGVDLRIPFYRFKHGPWFRKSRREFKNQGGKVDFTNPIWTDFFASAGTNKGHYFHQDLLVANLIYQAQPIRHIDIGSRVDGFVAHVASFREIEVLDIRPIAESIHQNIKFNQMDLMYNHSSCNITDSLSCLHAIEHFGLGRYGDPINPSGHLIGFKNMLKLLSPNGRLYISFPVNSSQTKTYFNAHRVFNFKEVLSWHGTEELSLLRFDLVDDFGDLHTDLNIDEVSIRLEYGCGIYTFIKK